MKYPDAVTCPKCGRENVEVNHDNEERMVSHTVPRAEPGDVSPRPRCPAASRRPENALITGSIQGRSDLRLKR